MYSLSNTIYRDRTYSYCNITLQRTVISQIVQSMYLYCNYESGSILYDIYYLNKFVLNLYYIYGSFMGQIFMVHFEMEHQIGQRFSHTKKS